jgi:ankyrin repeat protein
MNELTGSTSSIKYDTTAAFHEKDVKKTIVGSNTPLHWACYQGYADVTSILLNAGFGIEDIDPVGNRPLHLACSGGYSEVVEVSSLHVKVLSIELTRLYIGVASSFSQCG